MRMNGITAYNKGAYDAVIAEQARTGKNMDGSRLFSKSGEINAYSATDAFNLMRALMNQIQSGAFVPAVSSEVASANSQPSMTPEERQRVVAAAYHDSNPQTWAEVGSGLASTINDRVQRDGFTRKLLVRGEVSQGYIVRSRVKQHNIWAIKATGPTQAAIQVVRDKYEIPEEITIHTNLFIEQREIEQGSRDILSDKFVEGLEAIQVQEDRIFLNLARQSSTVLNDLTYYADSVTPSVLGVLKNNIEQWNLSANHLLLSTAVMNDISTGGGFESFFSPVSQQEIITTGRLGTLLGMELLTDGFRDPQLQVLDPHTMYAMTKDEYLGTYTDRGPVESQPTTNMDGNNKSPGKGWYQWEIVSETINNPRGIAQVRKLVA